MTHAGVSSGGDQGEDDDYLYSDHLYVNRPEEKFACPICLCPVQRVAHLTSCCGNHFCFKCISRVTNANKVVSQARLSLWRRESGQIPIRLLCCILSSRAPNEVGVNINWDVFCKGRSSLLRLAL